MYTHLRIKVKKAVASHLQNPSILAFGIPSPDSFLLARCTGSIPPVLRSGEALREIRTQSDRCIDLTRYFFFTIENRLGHVHIRDEHERAGEWLILGNIYNSPE